MKSEMQTNEVTGGRASSKLEKKNMTIEAMRNIDGFGSDETSNEMHGENNRVTGASRNVSENDQHNVKIDENVVALMTWQHRVGMAYDGRAATISIK